MSNFIILKLSGHILDSEEELNLLPDLILKQQQDGNNVIIVHGAGKQVDKACLDKAIPVKKINGRRITSPEIMNIMLELVHGKLNRLLVGKLLSNGIESIGITTADANLLAFNKRKPKEMNGELVDFGQVGDFVSISVEKLRLLSSFGTLVLSCIGFDPQKGWLNVNADTITKEIALAINAKQVLMASETAGVKNAEQQWMKTISIHQIQQGIKQGWIQDGMIVKLEQAIELAEKGIEVQIGTLEGLANNSGTSVIK